VGVSTCEGGGRAKECGGGSETEKPGKALLTRVRAHTRDVSRLGIRARTHPHRGLDNTTRYEHTDTLRGVRQPSTLSFFTLAYAGFSLFPFVSGRSYSTPSSPSLGVYRIAVGRRARQTEEFDGISATSA
jgi:hypothetical protein